MDDRPPEAGQWPEGLASLLTVCTSCRRLHPRGYACACLVDRAQIVAETLHDLRRSGMPRWRRPRAWGALPEAVRQDYTAAGLTLVDALEGSGWRLVTERADGTHVLSAPEPEADPNAVTPPSGEFRVPNVIR